MTRVYLDPSAIFLDRDDQGTPVVAPEAENAVAVLEAEGHEVLVVGAIPSMTAAWTKRLGLATAPVAGDSSDLPAWFITGDRSRCGTRQSRLRTVLVGGGPPSPTARGRCDIEAIDLHGAVLAILSDAVAT